MLLLLLLLLLLPHPLLPLSVLVVGTQLRDTDMDFQVVCRVCHCLRMSSPCCSPARCLGSSSVTAGCCLWLVPYLPSPQPPAPTCTLSIRKSFYTPFFWPVRRVLCAIIKGNNFTKLTRQMLRQQQQQQPFPPPPTLSSSCPTISSTHTKQTFDNCAS